MRAVIFGAGGQVGRALLAEAPAEVEVTALTRAECDVSDMTAVSRIFDEREPALIFNAAGYTAVDRAESEEVTARRLNATVPGQLAALSHAMGSRFVHISTDFVFDGQRGRPYNAHDPVAPLGIYGRTKLEGEEAVRTADPDALVVRTAWVYAAQGANFVRTMLRLMADRGHVRVVADQVGSPTYAVSLAGALWRLSAADATGLHHYTDAGVASWYDVAVAVAEEGYALGLLPVVASVEPIRTEDYPTPARRPAYSVLDKTATWAVLGGAAPHWRESLRQCLSEIKSHA